MGNEGGNYPLLPTPLLGRGLTASKKSLEKQTETRNCSAPGTALALHPSIYSLHIFLGS